MSTSAEFRALADFIDAHPDLPVPEAPAFVFGGNKEIMLRIARISGATKVYDDNYLTVTIPITPEYDIGYLIQRETVCEIVATETITVPAKDAYTYEKPTKWKCHPLLEPSKEVKR